MQSRPTYTGVIVRLFDQQDGKCLYCQRKMFLISPTGTHHPLFATVEHRTPQSMGGTDALKNLAASCAHCNYLKQSFPEKIFLKLLEYCGGDIFELTEALHGKPARLTWEAAALRPIPEQPERPMSNATRWSQAIAVAAAIQKKRPGDGITSKKIPWPDSQDAEYREPGLNKFSEMFDYTRVAKEPSMFPWMVTFTLFSWHPEFDYQYPEKNTRWLRTKNLLRAKQLALREFKDASLRGVCIRITATPPFTPSVIYLYGTVCGGYRWTDQAEATPILELVEEMRISA